MRCRQAGREQGRKGQRCSKRSPWPATLSPEYFQRAREPRSAKALFDVQDAEKKIIRLGKRDKKDKETEVTWFCSWLSDAEADGSGLNWKLGRHCTDQKESGEWWRR